MNVSPGLRASPGLPPATLPVERQPVPLVVPCGTADGPAVHTLLEEPTLPPPPEAA